MAGLSTFKTTHTCASGRVRTGRLHLEAARADGSRPLVVALHGRGQSGYAFSQKPDFGGQNLAGYSLYFPDARPGPPGDVATLWRTLASDPPTQFEDEADLRDLVGQLQAIYGLTTPALVGFSNGGMLTWQAFANCSDLFVGYATFSIGVPVPVAACPLSLIARPMLSCHLLEDDVIPYAGDADYLSADATRDLALLWSRANASTGVTTTNPPVAGGLTEGTTRTFQPAAGGARVDWKELHATPGSAPVHHWPTIQQKDPYNAIRVALDFWSGAGVGFPARLP